MTDEKSKIRKDEEPADMASRARNRTVMLTPDITGQVRARLQQEMGQSGEEGFFTPTSVQTQARAPRIEGRTTLESQAALPPGTPAHSAVAPVQAKQPLPQTATLPLIGFLVSFDNGPTGEYFELRTGRIIVTSEPSAGGYQLLIEHESVSPMHAILRVAQSGEIQVLDQLSEHGTIIRRMGSSEEEQLCGDKSALENGDVVQFGKRRFIVCVIQRSEE